MLKNNKVLIFWVCIIIALFSTYLQASDLDWSAGKWGVKITDSGTEGSQNVDISLPSGNKSGNALEVYYSMADNDIPQFWVFLIEGFWRQVRYNNSFGTSYRLFRYYSSDDENSDEIMATEFKVVGLTDNNNLEINLAYENNAAVGDRFQITANVLLSPPNHNLTSMDATITIKNISGYAVTPSWQGHLDLAEQWELFGISSMYVADNLSEEWPAWYDNLDPDHEYVGITDDWDYLNDGFSKNGQIDVSTHDVKKIIVEGNTIELDYDTCPSISVPGYTWYKELILLDQISDTMKIEHLYENRNHQVEILSCEGITSDIQNLKWAVTYNRDDQNMVDGDNIQIKLGMDDFLYTWPNMAYQSISLKLSTGKQSTRELVTEIYVATFGRAPAYDGLTYWTNAVDTGGFTIDQVAQSFFDQPETQEKFPEGSSNSEFITTIFDNVLNRAPADSGLAYWVDALDSGVMRRDQAIMAIINGAKAATGSSDDAAILAKKTKIGVYFANTEIGMSVIANEAFMDWATNIINFAASDDFLEEAKEYISGIDLAYCDLPD